MSKSNAVRPINLNQTEIPFITELNDSDRFKDLSFFIYQQNSQLYKIHFTKLDQRNNAKLEMNHVIPEAYVHSQQSKVCSIL